MPEYAPEPDEGRFAQSRAFFAGIEEWLSGPVAAGLTHAELEAQQMPRPGAAAADVPGSPGPAGGPRAAQGEGDRR